MPNPSKTKTQLAAARRKARGAAQGQLNGISANIGSKRFNKQAARTISNLKRYERDIKGFGRDQLAGVERDRKALAAGGSSTGASSTVMDSMVTSTRRAQDARQGRYAGAVAGAGVKLGKATKKAGAGALTNLAKTDAKSGRVANTILDVLESERSMLDARFVAEIREKAKDRRFQMKMLDRQAEVNQQLIEFQNTQPMSMAETQQMLLDSKLRISEATALSAITGGAEGPGAQMMSAVSMGQDVAAAASNAYTSDWLPERVAALRGADGSEGLTDADLQRVAIVERVADLGGGIITPEAIDRIVYDVVRNRGETSSDFVTGTITSSNPEWASAANTAPALTDSWAMMAHALSLAVPPESWNKVKDGAGNIVDTISGWFDKPETSAEDAGRLLAGGARNPQEARQADEMYWRLGFSMRPGP